ncbi:conserved membrane hypothetical protein [Desulfamplus magnetovallimortis]|uniref:DUF106 domain-containing protein n=1 Tax=Desulfamplus magnetovallimortis TaxID=1246637 RepID=A0A1W1H5A0_9BACT|nr:hypothetical protein [Desulfamplus magnetovallimortis]SLM27624.1 conserved membrane hypothetical protein [Desulfamplus magnetovallimortis]
MDSAHLILKTIDPVLIFPYRFFDNPMTGWFFGTFCLAVWSVVIGELTMMVAGRINRKAVSENLEETIYYHEQSMKAKQAGDETAWHGINKLANEAYGKSFFLLMAMGMAALWPAFFAAAWLDSRFGELRFVLPGWAGGLDLSFLAPFILFYIFLRIGLGHVKKSWVSTQKLSENFDG